MSGRRGWQGKVFIATSVDGYIARADGDIAWLTDPPPITGHAKPPADPLVIPGYESTWPASITSSWAAGRTRRS